MGDGGDGEEGRGCGGFGQRAASHRILQTELLGIVVAALRLRKIISRIISLLQPAGGGGLRRSERVGDSVISFWGAGLVGGTRKTDENTNILIEIRLLWAIPFAGSPSQALSARSSGR